MSKTSYEKTRKSLDQWHRSLAKNVFDKNLDFQHTIYYHLQSTAHDGSFSEFANNIVKKAIPLVNENNLDINLPTLQCFDSLGNRIEKIHHHPNYKAIGNIIYQSGLMKMMAKSGDLFKALSYFYLSCHAGEAGHNCPIACSAGILRIFQKNPNIPNKDFYLKKLTATSYDKNYTGAQFITEIQGGSDVGQNATTASKVNKTYWQLTGEKWFTSNANAELILTTARISEIEHGTKGLGLFLVPRFLDKAEKQLNQFSLNRLKDKLGTRSLATGELCYDNTLCYPILPLKKNFNLLMEDVLHTSRIFNSVCLLGMVNRAFTIAKTYATHRTAFGQKIIHYPLVMENLSHIKASQLAMQAGVFDSVFLQDQLDRKKVVDHKKKRFVRLTVNLLKTLCAKRSVEHIHHCVDILAGNGVIEDFSELPRLLRDSLICENWEGTHNTLMMQILRDVHILNMDDIFIKTIQHRLIKLKIKGIDKYQTLFETLQLSLLRAIDTVNMLRDAKTNLQSLLIKDTVHNFSNLYCALCLFSEGIDQWQTTQTQTKLHALSLFLNDTLAPNSLNLNQKFKCYQVLMR